jgi:hypothetical protein
LRFPRHRRSSAVGPAGFRRLVHGCRRSVSCAPPCVRGHRQILRCARIRALSSTPASRLTGVSHICPSPSGLMLARVCVGRVQQNAAP